MHMDTHTQTPTRTHTRTQKYAQTYTCAQGTHACMCQTSFCVIDFPPQAKGLDLSRVRTCVVVAEERPRTALSQSFSKLFRDLGLHARAVSTSFGCRVNLAICLQVGVPSSSCCSSSS